MSRAVRTRVASRFPQAAEIQRDLTPATRWPERGLTEKTDRVNVRIYPDEKAGIAATPESFGLGVSEYLLRLHRLKVAISGPVAVLRYGGGYQAHAFLDGGYLRELARERGLELIDPLRLSRQIVEHEDVQQWAQGSGERTTALTRITYYDGWPGEEVAPELKEYWEAIELLPDTHLGFGSVRGRLGRRRPRQQKGVDTLIAVDMLVGAFTEIASVAVLVSGDADFVPVVEEVRRRGIKVILAAADDRSLASELRRAADRFIPIGFDPASDSPCFVRLNVAGRTWTSALVGTPS